MSRSIEEKDKDLTSISQYLMLNFFQHLMSNDRGKAAHLFSGDATFTWRDHTIKGNTNIFNYLTKENVPCECTFQISGYDVQRINKEDNTEWMMLIVFGTCGDGGGSVQNFYSTFIVNFCSHLKRASIKHFTFSIQTRY